MIQYKKAMPFPLEEKFILQAEKELDIELPKSYREKMTQENGGEIDTSIDIFTLFTIYDNSDRKRIKRTATNNIVAETKNVKAWRGFPKDAIAIGANGSGDILVLKIESEKKMDEKIYVWNHETSNLILIANEFSELIK